MGLIHNRCRWNANHANLCERISSHSMRTCTVYTPVWNIAMENDQFATGQFLYIDCHGLCRSPDGILQTSPWFVNMVVIVEKRPSTSQFHNVRCELHVCGWTPVLMGASTFSWLNNLHVWWLNRILQDETTIFIHVHPFSHHSSGWNQHLSTIFSIIPPCIHHVSIIFHDKNWWLAI